MICFKHFQSHEFQMRKGVIFKLVPGTIPSVFRVLEKNIQIPETTETPLSPELPELSELPKLTTLTPEIAPSDQCVHEDENRIRLISSHRRWREKARYTKKKVNRLRATAKQLSQTISEMKKQQKKDAELFRILEVL